MSPPQTTQSVRSLHDEVRALFQRENWGFTEVEGSQALVCELSGPLGSWALCVQVVEEAAVVIFYSVLPLSVPADRRPAMSEFLARVNYRLSLGSFEMDYDDGELRTKVTLPVGGRPDEELVERCIRISGRLTETYLRAIESVADGAEPSAAARLDPSSTALSEADTQPG